jgi:hypothetical protein
MGTIEIRIGLDVVKSSNIESIGYDKASKILRIRFLSGLTYDYSNVPARVFSQLKNAESKTAFAREKIFPRYIAKRVGDDGK